MRNIVLSAGLLVLMAPGLQAVPSFARQTGLACYQCHITFGAPVPDFTWTGFMFKLNGYRLPWAGEKFEAGSEGALSGNRMVVPVVPYLAFRFQSTFATQTRNASGDWGSVTSNPTSRFSFFPGGPFGDYFSLWAELYATPDGSATQQWGIGNFSFDEYDLRVVKRFQKATVGVGFSTQSLFDFGGFGPWPAGLTDYTSNGNYRGWAHPNRGLGMAYGFLFNRLYLTAGAGPGEDNFDWSRRLYVAQGAYALLNRDNNFLWISSGWQFGNDGIPLLTNVAPSQDGSQTWDYTSNVGGIDGTRTGPGAGTAYLARDMDHYYRSVNAIRFGMVDLGQHSFDTQLQLSLNKETYLDNASVLDNAVGFAVRYTYNRTWGLDVTLDHKVDFRFNDMSGGVHDINTNYLTYSTWLTFRPAANVLFGLNYANAPQYAVNLPVQTLGRRWTVNVDFLF